MDTNNVTILGCPGAPAAPTATPAAPTTSPTAPTATPALPILPPATGGSPLESGSSSWTLVLLASVMGSLGVIVLGLSALRLSAEVSRRRQ